MRVAEVYLGELRAAGLLVFPCVFPPNHAAYPDGCIICKPKAAGGNCIPSYANPATPDSDVVVDAPRVVFYIDQGEWIVTVDEYIPGPGPGDFVNRWESPRPAVADILDYFFGDPSRMLVARQADEEIREQQAQRLKENSAEPSAAAGGGRDSGSS